MKQIVKTLVFLLVPLLFAGCEENETNGNGNDQPAENEVWMENLSFNPQTRTVTAGTTVLWINRDNVLHNVTSTEFTSSGNLGQGATHSVTFNEEGTFHYVCTLHPGMEGTIVVTSE